MKPLTLMLAIATATLASQCEAQIIPRVVYYAPAPVVSAPVVSAPVYAAPAPTVVYRPVVPAAPVVAAPVAIAPVPAIVPAVAPVATTRYRPILGGTVTRYRYYYAPTVVAY